MYRLVIAEKKSVAQSISAVLSANERKGGFFIGNGYIVSWCAGHLLELAAPDTYDEKYAKWRYADLPIIPFHMGEKIAGNSSVFDNDKWKYAALKGKKTQLKILTDLMSRADVDCIINACDAGREGENIFRSVYNHAGCTKKILRLWISSMEDAAIKTGFDSLINGAEYDNLYAAASCRERADWIVGINATRLFSVLYNQTLNTGRVQSPTLAMLVKRDADIAAFAKEPFYMPTIEYSGLLNGSASSSGDRADHGSESFSILAQSSRQKDKQTAEAIRDACNGKVAVVKSVEKLRKTMQPPKLHDLTSLQREANRLYGFTAAQTLEYTQAMYEKAITSYPRVDSRYITEDMRGTVTDLIYGLQNVTSYCCGESFAPDIDRLIDDKRVSDHHAIIPTADFFKADISALSVGERDILNLIISRLLCAVAPIHSYLAVTVTLDCEGYSFTSNIKEVIDDGWKAVDAAFMATLKQDPDADAVEDNLDDNDDGYGSYTGASDSGDNATLPTLSKGQTLGIVTAKIKEGSTTPPKHFTEDTLLSSMESAGAEDMPDNAERRGLGTPATRASIIEKLVKIGFVERKKKNLITTEKGRNLIAVLPDVLTSPKLTAEWEHRLMQIQRGKLSPDVFMDNIAEFITMIVKENNVPKPEAIHLFRTKESKSESLGSCPRCTSAIREGAIGFFCDTSICGFKLWKASKFWTAKKKPLTAAIVTALLKDGQVPLKNLYSEKTDKKYDAVVVLDDTGDGYVNFKLKFE